MHLDAVLACSEEVSALRVENQELQREVEKLRSDGEADKCEMANLLAQLESERRRSAELTNQLAADIGRTRSRTSMYHSYASPVCGRKRSQRPWISCDDDVFGTKNSGCKDEKTAKLLADIEIEALSAADEGEEHARIRRRLQMKWHPDKNSHNTEFATRVLQEMQQRPEWQTTKQV